MELLWLGLAGSPQKHPVPEGHLNLALLFSGSLWSRMKSCPARHPWLPP